MDLNVPAILVIIIALTVFLLGLLAWLFFGKNGVLRSYPRVHSLGTEELERKRAEFQAELRERGLLDLEKAVSENATFIRDEVRRTAGQLNGYMQHELQRVVDQEIGEYSRASGQINQMAIDSMARLRGSIDGQQRQLYQRMLVEMNLEKRQLVEQFKDNMAGVVSYYVKTALGDRLSIDDQMEYIIEQLESNKQAIAEDLRDG